VGRFFQGLFRPKRAEKPLPVASLPFFHISIKKIFNSHLLGDNIFKTHKDFFLVQTGQVWKIKTSLFLSIIGFLFFILMVWGYQNPDSPIFKIIGLDNLQIRTCFLLLGLIASCLLFLSVKCPNCRKKPIYHIINSSGLNDWILMIFNFKRCPFCGYSGRKIEAK
jgi:hypothetical protein